MKKPLWLYQLLIRLETCFKILTLKHRSWVLVTISKKELTNLVMEDEFEVDICYHKLQKYCTMKILQETGESFSEIDMLEEQLRFEVMAEQYSKKK